MSYWVPVDPMQKTRVHVTTITEARKLAIATLNNPGMSDIFIPIYKTSTSKKACGMVEMVSPGHYAYLTYDKMNGAQSYAIKKDGTVR